MASPLPHGSSPNPRGYTLWLSVTMGLTALIYGWGMPLGVMTDDSAEFQTLFVTLGTAHAPGYPLLLLLGKGFSMIPLGEIAWRGTLLSTLAGLATVALLFRLVWRLTGSAPAAGVAALSLALSHTFWMQSLLPEAYALNALFHLILLLLMERAHRDPTARGRAWMACAFLTGLAFGNHQTIILFVPVGAAWFLWLEGRQATGLRWARLWRATVGATISGLLGMSVYAALAIRMNTLGGTLDEAMLLARGGDARDLVGVFGPAEILKRCVDFCFYLAFQFPGPGALAAVVGVVAGWRRNRAWTLILLALATVTTAWGLNFDSSDIYVFYIPAYVAVAGLVGLGLAWLIATSRSQRRLAGLTGVLALGAVAGPPLAYALSWNWLESRGAVLSPNKGNLYYLWPPRRSAVWMADNVRCLMEAAPDHSLLLADWSYYHIAAYFQQVERFRRDLLPLDRERNQTGVNSWVRKTQEFFEDRATPVILTGSDQRIEAQFDTIPFGPGFIVPPPNQTAADWIATTHREWAFRGRLKKLHISPFYTRPEMLPHLTLTIRHCDDPAITLPARRPLYDHAGRGLSPLGYTPASASASPSPRSVIWPLAIPHHLPDGRPTPAGRYEVRVGLVDAADSPTTQVQTFQLR